MTDRRRRVAVLAILTLVLVSGAWWQFGRRDAPPGQSPLTTIDAASLSTLRDEFNGSADSTRLIAIVAPT